MKTPIIETERLILRPFTMDDAEEVYRNWTSDPEVAKYMSWSTHENIEVTKAWLATVVQRIDNDIDYDWVFVRKSDNTLIGSGGIYYKEETDTYTLGYNIMKSCWHQGYTTEAARAILKFAEETLKATRFRACHAKENPNSGKVMEKVGFHYVEDGHIESIDGTKHFESKEYILEVKK